VFGTRLGVCGATGPLLAALLFLVVFDLLIATFKFTIKFSPFYLSWLLGFFGGFLHFERGFTLSRAILLVLFPLILSFNLHEKWIHKIEYGNFTGTVSNPQVIPFEFLDRENNRITPEVLDGKVVLLDFWFIGCGPCWEKFPDLQRLYEQHKDNPSFKLYAVNRFDDPEKAFSRIEEKGYTFEVLLGNQEQMDVLGVYVYPTVILLNKKGEVVFMGELDEAESMLVKLLSE
jgi:thiol-disulfide isomerase/thioredoxin